MSTTKVSPPNSIIFIYDHSNREVDVPAYMNGALVAANSTCISVGTLAFMDGETEITLTDDSHDIEVGELVFDGTLQTPGMEVSICNSLNEKLLAVPVSDVSARVRVFANDPSEPDRIVVLAMSEA